LRQLSNWEILEAMRRLKRVPIEVVAILRLDRKTSRGHGRGHTRTCLHATPLFESLYVIFYHGHVNTSHGHQILMWDCLEYQKSVVCVSVILQSANETCNHLQGILGIFVHSANMPQHVIEVLTHAGLSISIKSIQWAVKSMSIDSAQKIKEGLRTLKVAMAYDNFNISFKTSEPTIAHQSSFVSATSATAIPLVAVENIDALRCSAALWSVDPCNPSPLTPPVVFNDFDLLKFHRLDTYCYSWLAVVSDVDDGGGLF
jgi:hypothetical protein